MVSAVVVISEKGKMPILSRESQNNFCQEWGRFRQEKVLGWEGRNHLIEDSVTGKNTGMAGVVEQYVQPWPRTPTSCVGVPGVSSHYSMILIPLLANPPGRVDEDSDP